MNINKKSALKFWDETYGEKAYIVKDFHGNYMCRDAYADKLKAKRLIVDGIFII